MKQKIDWVKIEKGLFQYKEIMTIFKCSQNIEKDDVLQKRYKTFYRMNTARKDAQFYKGYFNLLKNARQGDIVDMPTILKQLKRLSNKHEISFASKLLATVDPKLPIWDSRVRERVNERGEIKLKANYKNTDECVEAYNSLVSWYGKFMKSNEAKMMIAEFDSHFPKEKISAIKKVDFIFWQTK
jgi:hypothetical protein